MFYTTQEYRDDCNIGMSEHSTACSFAAKSISLGLFMNAIAKQSTAIHLQSAWKLRASMLAIQADKPPHPPDLGAFSLIFSDLEKCVMTDSLQPWAPGRRAEGQLLVKLTYKPFEDDEKDTGYREAEAFAMMLQEQAITDIKSAAGQLLAPSSSQMYPLVLSVVKRDFVKKSTVSSEQYLQRNITYMSNKTGGAN